MSDTAELGGQGFPTKKPEIHRRSDQVETGCISRIHSANTFLTMRLSQSPPTLLSLLSVVLSSTHTANAKPYPRDDLVLEADSNRLERRDCAIPCGWSGQLCCEAGQACFTDSAGQAQCGTTNQQISNGQWQLFTTTYVETDLVTRTSTYSSLIGASATVAAPTLNEAPAVTSVACSTELNEIPCGGICCAQGQYCQWQGQCGAVVGGNGDFSSVYLSSVMNTGSAFIRPTSNGVQTVTSTGSATTTVPFSTPTATSGGSTSSMQSTTSNNGLSGGAIAGIVIGVLFGIALLLLLCACFCFKGLADGILGLLGLGPRKRKTETTYIEERHSTHGGGRRRWWGTGPARVDRPQKSSGGLGSFAAVAAGLTGLAIALGLKRRRDRRDKSSYGSGSYSYSDYTSASKYRP